MTPSTNTTIVMRLKQLFVGDGRRFYDLLDQLADHVVSAAGHLDSLVRTLPLDLAVCDRIHDAEQQADVVSHRVINLLNHTFLPPFPAEDVYAFVQSLDDAVDGVDEVAKQFCRYHVVSIFPAFVEQTAVLVRAAETVREGVQTLRRSSRLANLRPGLEELRRLERLGDTIYRAGLARLFDGTSDPLTVLRWQDLCGTVEEAIDACHRVGHVLERIALHNDG